jgi:hypothetical protein
MNDVYAGGRSEATIRVNGTTGASDVFSLGKDFQRSEIRTYGLLCPAGFFCRF